MIRRLKTVGRVKVDISHRSPNYSAGRPYGAPNVIVIHHWGSDGQKFDNVVGWLCRPNGTSSAHYVAEGGRVAELVSPANRAWHAGKGGNPRGIGIECRPECTAADFETVAKLIADLRDVYGPLPLARHKDYMSTDCPGRWGARLAELSAKADAYRAHPAGTASPGRLAVDGYAGRLTVTAWQKMLGTPADGVISSQPHGNKVYMPNVTAVNYTANPRGSALVQAWQIYLNKSGAKLAADGLAGPKTWAASQEFLNREAKAALLVDGVAGPATVRALQTWLNSRG